MRRELAHHLKGAVRAGALALLCAGPLAAAPDSPGQIESNRIEALDLAVTADVQALRSASDILASFGLGYDGISPALPALLPEGTARGPAFERFDIRLVLGMLAQAFGHKDNQNVIDAQGGAQGDALLLRAGRAGLDDLPPGSATRTKGRVTLHTPLVIWNEGTFALSPGDTLRLDDASGAFILNFGRMVVDGAVISSTGTKNPHDKDFRPFITTTGAGVIRAAGARFVDLGFGGTMKFSGLSIARNALERPGARSYVSNSVIERVRSLVLHADDGTILSGNRVIDASSAAVLVARSRDTVLIDNIISGPMTTNAIRVVDGSARTRILGNAVLGGDRAGILVKGASNDSEISGNIIWNRAGGGIKIDRVDCARLTGNILISNRQKGIEVRRSRDAVLSANMIANNDSAGIWISAQPEDAVTRVEDNILDANGAGLATATARAIILDGNDFSHQFPQFLAGDIVGQARFLAADMKGKTPMALSASGPVPISGLAYQCEGGG